LLQGAISIESRLAASKPTFCIQSEFNESMGIENSFLSCNSWGALRIREKEE